MKAFSPNWSLVSIALLCLATILVGLGWYRSTTAATTQRNPIASDFWYGKPYLWIWIPSPNVLRSLPAPHDAAMMIPTREAAHHGAAELEQLPPYLVASLRTLVNQNQRDFRIRFVTDASFADLIPHWKEQVGVVVHEHEQVRWRVLAMLHLVYTHGGLVVPPSTVAVRSLRGLIDPQRAVFVETPLRFGHDLDLEHPASSTQRDTAFLPDLRIFSAPAKHFLIERLMEEYVVSIHDPTWQQRARSAFLMPGHSGLAAPERASILHWQTERSTQDYRRLRVFLQQQSSDDLWIVRGQQFGLRGMEGKLLPLDAWMRSDHEAAMSLWERPDFFGLDVDESQLRQFRQYDRLFQQPLEQLILHDQSLLVELWRIGMVPTEILQIHTTDE